MEIIIKRIKALLSRGGLSENGIKVLEFMLEKKRLTKSSIKEEKNLYSWCGHMRKRLPMLKTSYRELNSILLDMGWTSFEKRRKRRVDEFWGFVNTHRRLPKSSVKEEKGLYQWCQDVWNDKRGLADRFPEVLAKLKEMRFGENSDIKMEKRVKDFWEFIKTHGRLPKASVKEEKSLYLWCWNMSHNNCGLADRYPDVLAKIKELKGQK